MQPEEKNKVLVVITTESGCNPEEGEYQLHLISQKNPLDLNCYGGVDDASLIVDCIENAISELELPEEGETEVNLIESGEWEDVFWHKYYEVISHKRVTQD